MGSEMCIRDRLPLVLPQLPSSSCTGRIINNRCFAGCTTFARCVAGCTTFADSIDSCQPPLDCQTSCIGGWQPRDTKSHLKVQLTEAAPAHRFPRLESCPWSGQSLRIAFLHLPKTAGESLVEAMAEHPLNFTWVHLDSQELLHEKYDLYIITVRDPVNATISAFNFIHPIGGDSTGPWSVFSKSTPKRMGCLLYTSPSPRDS